MKKIKLALLLTLVTAGISAPVMNASAAGLKERGPTLRERAARVQTRISSAFSKLLESANPEFDSNGKPIKYVGEGPLRTSVKDPVTGETTVYFYSGLRGQF